MNLVKLAAPAKPLRLTVLTLFLCLAATSFADARTLTLLWLRCDEPEDANVDEPELVVSTGGQTTSFSLPSMTRGDRYPRGAGSIGRILINGRTTILLYDRDNGRNDWFDADDLLGTHVVPAGTTNGRSVVFNLDGANYTLRYRVDP